MGNQMPARCMVPCNPICCAMCFHQDAGIRENDSEHKTGSIFANAASVLSMAAEEISLDDHLEKELANEVELWRMETSSTAVHTNDGVYRAVFASSGAELDRRSGHSIDSPSAFDSPNYGIESDLDDVHESRLDGRADRGRGFTNYAYGSGQRQSPSGAREGTGLSNISSGQEYSIGHSSITPVIESREETAMSLHTRASNEDASSAGPAESLGTVPQQSPQPAKFEVRDRHAVGPLRPSVPNGPGSIDAQSSGVEANGTIPVLGPQEHAMSSGCPSSKHGIASVMQGETTDEVTLPYRDDTIGSVPPQVPRDNTGVSLPVAGDSAAGGWLCSDPAEEAHPNETNSFSSSEDDSFPGFLEDPLEKEMQAPPANPLSNFRTVEHWPSDLQAAPGLTPGRQKVIKPSAKAVASFNALEGVRADRSTF